MKSRAASIAWVLLLAAGVTIWWHIDGGPGGDSGQPAHPSGRPVDEPHRHGSSDRTDGASPGRETTGTGTDESVDIDAPFTVRSGGNINVESIEAHEAAIDSLLGQDRGRRGIDAVLLYVSSLEHDEVTQRLYAFVVARLAAVMRGDPALYEWARERFVTASDDTAQCLLMRAVSDVALRGSGDEFPIDDLPQDFLHVYSGAGRYTQRNLASALPSFSDSAANDQFVDMIDLEDAHSVGDLVAFMNSVVVAEEWKLARAGPGSATSGDGRTSKDAYVGMLVGILSNETASEAVIRECLLGIRDLEPSALLTVPGVLSSRELSNSFEDWAMRYIETMSTSEPSRPPGM